MTKYRVVVLAVLASLILVVSCAAPAAPTSVPPTAVPPTSTTAPQPTVAPAATALPAAPTTAPVAPTTAPTVASTAPPATATKVSATATAAAQTKPGAPQKLNMDEIFPPGPGRDVVLNNCTTCHTFVPLVILQYPQQQWDLSARNHRDRVPRLSDADFNAAYAYLAKNFNPDRPVPTLPKELLDTWTDY